MLIGTALVLVGGVAGWLPASRWPRAPRSQGDAAHFADWRRRYDYVLLLNADAGRIAGPASLPELVMVRDEGFARLYRVTRNPHP